MFFKSIKRVKKINHRLEEESFNTYLSDSDKGLFSGIYKAVLQINNKKGENSIGKWTNVKQRHRKERQALTMAASLSGTSLNTDSPGKHEIPHASWNMLHLSA